MKYGESFFDVLYLQFAIVSGILILRKARHPAEKLMGWAALILGCGDAFHLIPRVLNTSQRRILRLRLASASWSPPSP